MNRFTGPNTAPTGWQQWEAITAPRSEGAGGEHYWTQVSGSHGRGPAQQDRAADQITAEQGKSLSAYLSVLSVFLLYHMLPALLSLTEGQRA